MRGLSQDMGTGLRVFIRRPGFALVVVLTLAVGVGGATAMYSVLRGVVLSPMEFPNADRVVALWGETPDYPRAPLTVGDYNALREGVEALEHVAAGWSNSLLLVGGERGEAVSVGWVTPDFFAALGVQPTIGRLPEAGEEAHVVLGHDLWVRRYGRDPTVIGRTVDLEGDPFEVVGVLPEHINVNLTAFSGARTNHDLWRLMPAGWVQGDDRSVGWLRPIALLAEGASVARAREQVDALMVAVNATVTDRDGGPDLRVNVTPVRRDLVGGVAGTLWILLGSVCGVLLVAAANVAHLMFARGEERRTEVGVRSALGGSRARLVRQFLVESSMLAAVGGVLGLGVALIGVRALLASAPPTLPRLESVSIDPGVLLFALGATAATVVVFGVVPAIRSTRSDLATTIARGRGTMDLRGQRVSRWLVVVQVALSLTLVTGTGLLLRSLNELHGADLGFDTENILTAHLQAPDWGDSNAEAASKLQAFTNRLEAEQAVESVGFSNRVPLGGGLYTGTFASEAMADAGADAEASFRVITPKYLETMGIRLRAGRSFRNDDDLGVALVDEVAAARAWPGEEALGRRVQLSSIGSDPQWAEVVGIVAAVRHAGAREPAAPTVYTPMLPRADQQPYRYVAVRTSGDPLQHLETLRTAVQDVDANAVLGRTRTMAALFDDQVAAPRFATLLLLLFGATALLLATIGLHGVMAYRMARRRRETGIRLALGAEPGRLLREAFLSGAGLVAAGLGFGAVLVLVGLDPVLRALVVNVPPADFLTVAGASVVILGAGLVGAYLPARLALAVDPVSCLKDG